MRDRRCSRSGMRAHRAQIGRDVLTRIAVAPGRALGEQPSLVSQADREAVELGLGRVLHDPASRDLRARAGRRPRLPHRRKHCSSDSIGVRWANRANPASGVTPTRWVGESASRAPGSDPRVPAARGTAGRTPRPVMLARRARSSRNWRARSLRAASSPGRRPRGHRHLRKTVAVQRTAGWHAVLVHPRVDRASCCVIASSAASLSGVRLSSTSTPPSDCSSSCAKSRNRRKAASLGGTRGTSNNAVTPRVCRVFTVSAWNGIGSRFASANSSMPSLPKRWNRPSFPTTSPALSASARIFVPGNVWLSLPITLNPISTSTSAQNRSSARARARAPARSGRSAFAPSARATSCTARENDARSCSLTAPERLASWRPARIRRYPASGSMGYHSPRVSSLPSHRTASTSASSIEPPA